MRKFIGLTCAILSGLGLLLALVRSLPFDGANAPGIPLLSQHVREKHNDYVLWQLGRKFQHGEGVPRDDYQAFEYYQQFADAYAEASPAAPVFRNAADAFVQLAHYYQIGIPGSPVVANPANARRLLTHAAVYFGDPEAQYQLARLLLEGKNFDNDPRRAVRWLVLAAQKDHQEAQALLGRILFNGEVGHRQPAAGLMWLAIACDGPGCNLPWIAEAYQRALKEANDNERAQAGTLLVRWVNGGR